MLWILIGLDMAIGLVIATVAEIAYHNKYSWQVHVFAYVWNLLLWPISAIAIAFMCLHDKTRNISRD